MIPLCPARISLHGRWRFALDPGAAGETERWFARDLPDSIPLPGTTDENGKGPENPQRETRRLTRVHPCVGAAFYQRDVDIPPSWEGKRIVLCLERSKTSTVWVDDRCCGGDSSLATPQRFDLSDTLTPGRHRLTLRVDNAKIPPGSEHCHQISESTQTNWNGILGRIELTAGPLRGIRDLRAYPDVEGKALRLRLHVPGPGTLHIRARAENTDQSHERDWAFPVTPRQDGGVELTLDLGPEMLLWDEFHPALYRMEVTLESEGGCDHREFRVGMRSLSTAEGQIVVNGRKAFLRGKHDACVFPLTGYAPMDTASWRRVFGIAKSYGINHYRFHGWCPPRAAFEAADELGMYLQPELPFWSVLGPCTVDVRGDVEMHAGGEPGSEEAVRALLEEGARILREYGNHASFCMLALGNELRGDIDAMAGIVRRFRAADPRRLYAQGSNNFLFGPRPGPADDYWTTAMTGGTYAFGNYHPDCNGHEVRGSYCVHTQGHVNNRPPGTRTTYAAALEGVPLPVIGHEVGQYQVFPDFSEIPKYTGVLQAHNLEVFRDNLTRAGLLHLARDFQRASGALAVLCYREDIEAALRTPGFGGFQLLDLQDFPGQGTALVGILDAFLDSKGLIPPETWRRFCGDTVLLACFDRYTWTTEDVFSADLFAANHGPLDLSGRHIVWELAASDGVPLARGEQKLRDDSRNPACFGRIEVPLKVSAPQKLTLHLHLRGTDIRNDYPLWVYASDPLPASPGGVRLTRTLDEDARAVLASGGAVLYCPDSASLPHAVPGAFQTDFWSYPMFKKYNPPGTMGILCDPAHPALRGFPTEFHANWQWWPLLRHGCALVLDGMPRELEPIVRVIDNVERCHSLANLFECRALGGRLLVCTCDLLNQQQHPEARQLLASLLAYAASEAFAPYVEIGLFMHSGLRLAELREKSDGVSVTSGLPGGTPTA